MRGRSGAEVLTRGMAGRTLCTVAFHLTCIQNGQQAKAFDGIFVILPQFFESREVHEKYEKYPKLPEGFSYRSDKNEEWLTVKDLIKILKDFEQ